MHEGKVDTMKILQQKSNSSVVLALTYDEGPVVLKTDACNVEVEYVLLRKQPDKTPKPIRY